MLILLAIIKRLWWFCLAFLPVLMHRQERLYMDQIGCPPRGDCYVPGSELLLGWDLLIIGSALFIWPACFWFLVVVPIRDFAAKDAA
jgi:hypothetical protein